MRGPSVSAPNSCILNFWLIWLRDQYLVWMLAVQHWIKKGGHSRYGVHVRGGSSNQGTKGAKTQPRPAGRL